VIESSGNADLAQKPLGSQGIAELRVEYLERHWACMLQVVREKHRSHATPADLTVEVVSVGAAAREGRV
jgi:hypothetical protein